MICPYCGKENVDGSPFCAKCGQSLADVKKDETKNAQPQPNVQYQQTAQETAQTTAQATAQTTAQTQPQYQQAAQPQYQQAAKPVYAQGCMGAAWSDITSTAGWFKKVLLLGLVGCVPILNFYVLGYCMRWARQLVLGKVEPMPEHIFEEGNFSQGFYCVVWLLVTALAFGLISSMLSFIPILGFIASVCISLFSYMFIFMGSMRLSISKQLGTAFHLQEDWRGFIKNFGSLFVAAIVPCLIVSAILFVVCMIVVLIICLFALQAGFGGVMYMSGYNDVNAVMQILGAIAAMLPLILVMGVAAGIMEAFTYLWTFRAVGHYVARELPEWRALAPQNEQ